MAMQKNLFVKLAKTCLVAAVVAGVTIPTWAGQPVVAAKSSPNAKSAQKAKRAQPKAKADASGISFKVTGVAVLDETQGDRAVVKYLPPDTRVVVPSARHFALFRVEYDVPTNMNACIFLGENCDTARLGLGFRTGASGLYKGIGTVAKPLGLDSDVYDKGVLLKSVRLSAEIEGNDGEEAKSVYVGDATVNVLFAKDGDKKTDGFSVLEPLPPPPAKSTSLLPAATGATGARSWRRKSCPIRSSWRT